MATVITPEQGSQVTGITIAPVSTPVVGQATQMLLTVNYDNGNSQTATFAAPAGSQGLRGSGVYFFQGPPTTTAFPSAQNGDVVINTVDGGVWRFDGTNWNFSGSYLRSQKDRNGITQISVNQNNATTTYPAVDGGGVVKIALSNWSSNVTNSVTKMGSYYGYMGPNWRNEEMNRLSIMALQKAEANTAMREKSLNYRRVAVVQAALAQNTSSFPLIGQMLSWMLQTINPEG